MRPPFLTAADGTPASKFSFGTMQFGGKAGKGESQRLYEASRAAGLNFFETAYVYTNGLSEQFLGEFAADERDGLIIATKCASVGGSTASNIRSHSMSFHSILHELHSIKHELSYHELP